MKRFLSMYVFLFLSFLFISINVFCQALSDPGTDPLDSTTHTNDSTVIFIKGKKIQTLDFSQMPASELKKIFPYPEG